jgi:uncharacterized membrane protein YbaN (DUF454 family)
VVRFGYILLGTAALLLGAAGLVLPLLPTVPFVILAAFLFARGHPGVERWLLAHRHFGPHIHAWRGRRAISRRGKRAALLMLAASAALGFLLLPLPWSLLPPAACLATGAWIATRPDASPAGIDADQSAEAGEVGRET